MSRIKGNSLAPKLRFSDFFNSKNWEQIKLIDTSNKTTKWSFIGGPFGSNLKSSDYVDEGIRIIQLQNIGDAKFNNAYKIFTSKGKADELLANNVYPGEIILSKMGDPVGRACLIPDFHSRYVMCSDGIRLVVDEKNFSKYFVYTLINSVQFRSLIEKTATGSTRKRIGLDDLKKLPMFVPQKKEQQRIADCLSSIDELISYQSQKVEALKAHKKSLMQQFFPVEGEILPELRFSGFKGKWPKVPLSKICDVKGGKRIPKGNTLSEENTGFPYIRITDMYMGGVDATSVLYISKDVEKTIKNYKISKDDLFITVAGTIGLIGEIPEELNNANLTENANKIVIKSSVKKKYLLQFLTCDHLQIKIKRAITNNAQPKLSLERIRGFAIPLPTEQEQQKIADCLSSIDALITAQTRKNESLKTHKKGLMQQLFPSIDEVSA